MSTTRRGFLGTVAGLAAGAAAAQTVPAPPRTSTSSSPPAAPTPTPTPDPKAQAVARAAGERYGKFLSEEQRKDLEERIAALERRSARLRGATLSNSEEPALDFHVLRTPGRPAGAR
jgi:hypothetical protein